MDEVLCFSDFGGLDCLSLKKKKSSSSSWSFIVYHQHYHLNNVFQEIGVNKNAVM